MNNKLLVKNSISGVFQFVITAILTFACVPVLISKLGLEQYGVFAIFSVIANLSTLADLGMDRTLIVFLSNQGKCQESNYDITIALSIKFSLLILLLGIAWIFEDFILLQILAIPNEYYAESISFYHSTLFSNFLMIIGMTFASVLDALQKIYLNSIFRIIYSIIYWGGILLTALLGFGIKEIGYISILASGVWFTFTIIGTLKNWGEFNLTGLFPNTIRIFNKQVSYSLKIFSASLLNLFFEPLSKILISNFIGLNCVALFDIAIRIRGQIASLFSKAIYPLGPYIANTPNAPSLFNMIIDITKKIHLLVILVASILAFTSKALIYLWMGNLSDINTLSLYMSVLCGSFLLFVPPTYPIYQYLYTRLLAEKTVYIQCINVFVNLVIFIASFKILGIYTILLSNSMAYFCSYILSMYYLKIYVGEIRTNNFYMKIFLLFLLLVGTGLIYLILHPFSITDLFTYPFVFLLFFIIWIRVFSLISKDDINRYCQSYPLLTKLLSIVFSNSSK